MMTGSIAQPSRAAPFIAGFVACAVAAIALMTLAGFRLVSSAHWGELQAEIAALRTENEALTDELLRPSSPMTGDIDPQDLPYDPDADPRHTLAAARAAAIEQGKILMVNFGANWCSDCRALHRHLRSAEVAAYIRDRFVVANIDVGKFNRNRDIAAELGVSLELGIPVAVFFAADGRPIGDTNDGELERSRLYSSRQILKFVRDVAERSRVLAPDAVE